MILRIIEITNDVIWMHLKLKANKKQHEIATESCIIKILRREKHLEIFKMEGMIDYRDQKLWLITEYMEKDDNYL